MSFLIVGIGSKARVGKDSAAQGLVRDLNFTRIAFADAVRALALHLNPIVTPQNAAVNMPDHTRLAWAVRGMAGWEDAKDRLPEVRRCLQNLGVGARDVLGEDVWVNALWDKAERHDRVVVPDVRFPNEAEMIRHRGGLLIKVNRKAANRGLHVSETALDDWDDWDLVVDNDSTINELQAQVNEFVKQHVRKLERAASEPDDEIGDVHFRQVNTNYAKPLQVLDVLDEVPPVSQ